MPKKGCLNGCVHHKEIKLPEMRETYTFRCEAFGAYMKESDYRQSCRLYQGFYKIKILTVEDFLPDNQS